MRNQGDSLFVQSTPMILGWMVGAPHVKTAPLVAIAEGKFDECTSAPKAGLKMRLSRGHALSVQ